MKTKIILLLLTFSLFKLSYSQNCVADFNFNINNSGITTFTNNVETFGANLCNVFWDFGDGVTSLNLNPTHTYTNLGTYSVSLIVETSLDSSCNSIDCIDSISYSLTFDTIPDCSSFLLTYIKSDVTINGGNDGSIDLTVNGSTGTLLYDWSNGASTEDVSNLIAGIYSVFVEDNIGCSDSLEIVISEPPPCNLSLTYTSLDVTNNGGSDGSIDLIVSGGYGALLYDWSNGATSEDITNLSAGIYTVTATDSLSCEANLSIEITEPIFVPTAYSISGHVFAKTALLPIGIALLIDENHMVIQNTEIQNGYYEFLNLDSADYYVYAIPFFDLDFEYYPRYFATYFGSTTYWNQAQLISVDSVEIIDISLIYNDAIFYGNGLVCGHVKYDSESGFETTVYNQDWFENSKSLSSDIARNLTCLLIDNNNELVDYCLTNTEGEFRFDNVPFGQYRIHVEYSAIPMSPIQINLNATNDTICDLGITIFDNEIINVEERERSFGIVEAFPNPFNDIMNIKIDSNLGNTYELDLINIYGEVIYSSLVSDNYLKINAKNISSGIYVICLKSNSNVVFLKKIIKH